MLATKVAAEIIAAVRHILLLENIKPNMLLITEPINPLMTKIIENSFATAEATSG